MRGTRWHKTIDIKQFIHRDQTNTDPVYVAALGKEIAEFIRKHTTEDEKTFDLLDAVDWLETIDPEADDAIVDFNHALREIYDWADHERVWLGF